ncbi:hypothetical protein C5167_007241 [Papaver somniferum]|nr:hypothetical protein C5167_007241 [Papaver somniferum]
MIWKVRVNLRRLNDFLFLMQGMRMKQELGRNPHKILNSLHCSIDRELMSSKGWDPNSSQPGSNRILAGASLVILANFGYQVPDMIAPGRS